MANEAIQHYEGCLEALQKWSCFIQLVTQAKLASEQRKIIKQINPKTFEAMKIKKHEFNKLNKQEKEELIDLLNNGTKLTVGRQANRGWIDTPLFLNIEEQKQMKLF